MRRAVVLLGLGALIPPVAQLITATVLGRSWLDPKET